MLIATHQPTPIRLSLLLSINPILPIALLNQLKQIANAALPDLVRFIFESSAAYLRKWPIRDIAVAGLFFLLGAAVGFLAWGQGTEDWRLLWILFLPLTLGFSQSRLTAFLLMQGYYLAGTRGISSATEFFFDLSSSSAWLGTALWVASSLVLALPFAFFWHRNVRTRAVLFNFALVFSVIPPLGIIGWLSPFAVSGTLFPGWLWAGIVLSAAFIFALVCHHARWVALLITLSLVANGIYGFVGTKKLDGWEGVDTSFPKMSAVTFDRSFDAGIVLAGMERLEWIKYFAESVPANSIRLLPETMIAAFDGVARFSVQKVDADLRARNSRVIFGGILPQDNGQYKNVAIVLGAHPTEPSFAVQNMPVPISMWTPWNSTGAVANFFGRDNFVVANGVRAGILICYEELLAYSFLLMMLERPSAVLTMANVWWSKDNPIPVIQSQTVGAFARLFGVPIVASRNF